MSRKFAYMADKRGDSIDKLTHLRQHQIEKPCPKRWEDMEGGDQQRLCRDCGCQVYNIGEMSADEAEELLAKPDSVCTVVTSCQVRGILTRDGWIPRILAAGTIAASMSGCQLFGTTTAGAVMSKQSLLEGAETVHDIYKRECEPKDKHRDEEGCKKLLRMEKGYRERAAKMTE